MVSTFDIGDFVQFRSDPGAREYQRSNLKACADPFVITDIVRAVSRVEWGLLGDYAVWDSHPHTCPGAYLKHLELAEGPW